MSSFPLVLGGDHILYRIDMFNCKRLCSRLDGLLEGLIQTVQPLCRSNLQKPPKEQSPIYEQFLSILNYGVELVKKCEKTSRFNVFQNLRYVSQIHQLEKEILDFVQLQMPFQTILDVKNLVTELKSLRHMYELGSVDERNVSETILPKLTNDPHENAMMLQQMGPDDMLDGAFDEAPPCSYNGSVKSDLVMGLEKNISNLKRILLQREVSVVGVQGMGGVGKTTIAMALSEDQEIKDASKSRAMMRQQVAKLEVADL